MQRLHNLDKWQELKDGEAVNFAGTAQRRVRLDVNAPDFTRLYHSDANGVVTFLALVRGRDVIEFATDGEFAITAEGGPVWFHSIDGEATSFAIPDAVTLTKLIERRPRNHERELMMFMQNQNLERRLAAQRDELAALWDRRERAAAAAAAQPKPASDDGSDPAKSEPQGTAGSAGKPETADAGDSEPAKPAKAK